MGKLADNGAASPAQHPLSLEEALAAIHFRYFPKLGVAFGTVNEASLARAQKSLPVARVAAPLTVSSIRPYSRGAQMAQPSSAITSGIRAMRAHELWEEGLSGAGVRVGHVDTGVDATHRCLSGAIESFAFIDEMGLVDSFQAEAFDSDDHGPIPSAKKEKRRPIGRR